MSVRLTLSGLRAYAMKLRCEAMDQCIAAHALDYRLVPQKYAATKERGETLRRIANELDAMCDGATL